MRRKITTIILAVIMVISCMLPISATAEKETYANAQPISVLKEEGKTAKSGDVYSIANADELIAFSALAATNDYFRGCTIILTDDIDLNPGWTAGAEAPKVTWTPVPDFWGNFDGQGHTLSGLYKKGGNYLGLFSYVQYTNNYGDDVTIKNLNIKNSFIGGTGTNKDIAVLIGWLGNGKNAKQNTYIQNVNIDGIAYSEYPNTSLYVGEYQGPGSATVFFEDCVAGGSVQSKGNFAGGFVGTSWRHLNFKNCAITGDVTAKDYVGGYVGRTHIGYKAVFENCVSAAKVKSLGAEGAVMVGGFIGYQNNGMFSFTNCVGLENIKTSDGLAVAGGFIGKSIGVEGYFTRCLHYGVIDNFNNKYNTNAFIGKLDAATANASNKEIVFTDTFYYKLGDPYSRGIGGYTTGAAANIIRVKNTTDNIDVVYSYSANSGSAWNNYKALNDNIVKYCRKNLADITGIAAVANLKTFDFVNGWEIRTAAGYALPKAVLDASGMSTVPQNIGVDLLGVQDKVAENGKFAVRFVATVDGGEYTAVGFDIKAAYNGEIGTYRTPTTNTVYDSLIAGGYRAAFEVPQSKLCAQIVENIPATGTVIFEVSSFYVQGVDTEAKVTADDAYVFVYQDGAFVTSYIK